MTVVAVLRSWNDVLYIGTDSQWTDSEGLKNFKTKLTIVNSRDNVLIWATAGNPQIGVTEFGQWVRKRQRTDNETWQTFIEAAAEEFARLNGVRKRIGKAAGEDIDSQDFRLGNLCEMVICGRLNGETNAYYIGRDGGFQSIDTAGSFLSIGTGSVYAEAAYRTQVYLQRRCPQTDQEVFENLLKLTARHAKDCSLPYEYIKLTSGKLLSYRSKEPESGIEQTSPASQ